MTKYFAKETPSSENQEPPESSSPVLGLRAAKQQQGFECPYRTKINGTLFIFEKSNSKENIVLKRSAYFYTMFLTIFEFLPIIHIVFHILVHYSLVFLVPTINGSTNIASGKTNRKESKSKLYSS